MHIQRESSLHTRSTFVATLLSLLMTIGFAGLMALTFSIIVQIL